MAEAHMANRWVGWGTAVIGFSPKPCTIYPSLQNPKEVFNPPPQAASSWTRTAGSPTMCPTRRTRPP